MKIKKFFVSVFTALSAVGLSSCGANTPQNIDVTSPDVNVTTPNVSVSVPESSSNVIVNNDITVVAPNKDNTIDASNLKYVFLFIGDCMSYPQIQSAEYYLSSFSSGLDSGNKNNGTVLQNTKKLSFTGFSSTGSAKTYDATSYAFDSASTATSLASCKKTWSGLINMSTGLTIKYETIAEKLKKQKDYKIGIISSVNINHATQQHFMFIKHLEIHMML